MLFDEFVRITGIPTTLLSEIVSDDRAFVSRYQRSNMTFATYDRVAGRFSAIWPITAAWPADVPRPEPIEIPTELRDQLFRWQLRRMHLPRRVAMNADAEWPSDIPMPVRPNLEMERANGQDDEA